MYQRSIESAHLKFNTNMVNLPSKKQNSTSTAPSATSNNSSSNYKIINNNDKTNSNIIHNTNIIDSVSVSNNNSNSNNNNNNNLIETNQINNENRNQNVNANANVENYRPTYGAYITSILPRGPYLQYKFNDQQQQKQRNQQPNQPNEREQHHFQDPMITSHIHENDNNEHLNNHSHQTQHQNSRHYVNHEQQQIQSNPMNHHQGHQLETASACSSKDFCSLPYVVNANPFINNNPSSNYHHTYQAQHPVEIAGAANNMVSMVSGHGNSRQILTTQNMYNAQPCMTNINTNVADSRNQWNSIYHLPPSRAVRSSSNPSLQSFSSALEQGPAMTNPSGINWHRINTVSNKGSETSTVQDKVLPPKGYQTLPHKLKCGLAGGGHRDGGQHYRPIHHRHYHNPNGDSTSIPAHIKSRSAVTSGPANGCGGTNFLQQIKQQNSDMLARMSTTLAKNYGRTLSQQEIRYPLSNTRMNNELSRSTNALTVPNYIQTNCVTLDDVIRLRPQGLGEYEGWALLCQAVQALQDLFLTDTPSTFRILPLVRPSTIQITSRGRVVFIVTPTVGTTFGQLNKFNDMDTSPCQAVTAHLAPEFLSAIDKKVAFAESDIEKMWIYSLGITLRNIIRGHQHPHLQNHHNHQNNEPPLLYDNSSEAAINSEIMSIARCTYQNHLQCNQGETNGNDVVGNNPSHTCITSNNATNVGNGISSVNMNPYSAHNDYRCVLDISLDQVLGCMCERNLHQRASLMYLLDVISTFCRNQQQVKPFSHIVMELFAEVAAAPERDCDETIKGSMNPTALLADGSRSDTDSGRSSAHGDKDSDSNGQYDCQNPALPISDFNYDLTTQKNLRVIRNRTTENMEYQKYGTIGYAGVKALLMHKKEGGRAPALQVVRRNREGILKRKNSFRRNTIDINLFDLEKARQENFQIEEKNDLNKSKSTNCIDRIDDDIGDGLKNIKNDAGKRMEGVSMPDLNSHKITTLPTTRPKNYRLKSFEALTKAYSEDSFWIKPNGPEFIIKSSLPSREIEIVDSKSQHRKVVSVLLLNGQSLHISCNALTTNARQIFEAVIKSENYVENFFIGLCALIGGDFVFLPNDLKIYKVAPQIWINVSKKSYNIDNVFFTLFLRIKFFLPTLRGISSLESRHMLYLQLRKSILEKHILCTDDDLITLGGLALQAEVGDFKESMKYSDYFTISHYLPEGVFQRNKEMAKYLRNSHYCRHGLHPKEAEQNFIKYIQDMKEYGFHLYSAVWTTDDSTAIDVYVGISLGGIALFERNRQPQANPLTNSKTSYQRKLYMSFEWLEIENLCFSKHILCIVVRKTESLKAKDNNRIKYKLKMDGRKSYFAFSLASEHHQFYMKLRNSFISLKSLSDKLNIPIASTTTSASTHTIATGMADQFDGIELDYRESHKDNAARTNKDVGAADNKERRETDATRANNIPPNARNSGGNGGISSGIQENIKKIDKQLKASGLRVRNLKKSMLNDNRLMKLKQRFLRRSKSTVGACSTTERSHESDDSRKSSAKGLLSRSDSGSNFSVTDNNDRNNCGRSKEENQNKENECPKVQQLNDLEPKIYSPNRNRVKMGTRVFSTQFLNKSYDNIYDRTMNLYRFESANSINNDFIDNKLELLEFKGLQKCMDDGLSLRSASLNSLYSSEKVLNRCPESPQSTEAYVIHSSIKSDKDTRTHFNNFTLPNETISESLMEKFNNMSAHNAVTDRIITKVTVVKERLSKNQNNNNNQQNSQQNITTNSRNLNKKNDLIHNEIERTTSRHYESNNRVGGGRNYSKNSPKKHESIKYATLNQKMVKEYSDCVNSRNVAEMYSIEGNSEYSKALWHLSRSQESIFINNKFPVRNECLAVNQSNTSNLGRSGNSNNNNKYSAEASAAKDYSRGAGAAEVEPHEFTLGISIVQGSDNNVYVKDLVKNGPAEKCGIRIGDQIIAVNGISLLNLSYAESLRLLQNTGLIVELQVSQIFNKNLNSSRRPSTAMPAKTTTCKFQKDNGNLVVSRASTSSSSSSTSSSSCPATTKLKFANNERRNLNSILTNHCDEYLKRLEREHEEMDARDKREKDEGGFRFPGDANGKKKVTRQNGGHAVERIGKESRSMKRIGSFEITNDNIRATRDKFKSSGNVNGNLCSLSPAKSMPDLPKVVAIIPKPDHPDEDYNSKKLRIVRSASQSRKYLGPIRYPVTPIKTVLSPVRHQLSLLADSDDEQVFI